MTPTDHVNPLETFLRQYIEGTDGLWDQVEPQVYDLLLPQSLADREALQNSEQMIRVAFDPEALPEHEDCQYLTFGTPLLDNILADAKDRSTYARAHVLGLNLHPHDLPKQIAHRLTLPPSTTLKLDNIQPLNFTLRVHWFCATYISDRKEQDTFIVAIDAHDGKQVRHLDRLLDPARLYDATPDDNLADATQQHRSESYRLARDRVVRTISATANARRREVEQRCSRQEQRMMQYYHDLRTEVEQQITRALKRSQDPARALSRRITINREEKLRVAELRKKNSLRVHLRLTNLLEICQPKLRINANLMIRTKARVTQTPPRIIHPAGQAALPITLVWDPLLESLESPQCLQCHRPTFDIRIHHKNKTWACPTCAATH